MASIERNIQQIWLYLTVWLPPAWFGSLENRTWSNTCCYFVFFSSVSFFLVINKTYNGKYTLIISSCITFSSNINETCLSECKIYLAIVNLFAFPSSPPKGKEVSFYSWIPEDLEMWSRIWNIQYRTYTLKMSPEQAEKFTGYNFKIQKKAISAWFHCPCLLYDTPLLDYSEDEKRVEWKDGVIFSVSFFPPHIALVCAVLQLQEKVWRHSVISEVITLNMSYCISAVLVRLIRGWVSHWLPCQGALTVLKVQECSCAGLQK